ncbi:MAG: hypothetical protein F4Z13_01730, partial [Candidatus Dadabacteria bacterium]|nr:hypothetical protein [Candidatus Dadabacteria bacterium]
HTRACNSSYLQHECAEVRIAMAKEKGYTVLGLGERILRAETASVVSLALLQSRYGDI